MTDPSLNEPETELETAPAPAPPPPRSLTGRLQAMRENLAGQLGTPMPGLPSREALAPEALKLQAQAKLEQARADLEGSALGLVAAGVLRGATGTAAPAIVGTIDPSEVDLELLAQDPEAFSRQKAEDALAAKREAEAAASRKRMAFVVKYVKDPTAHDFFSDKTIVYQVFAEERTYQVTLLTRYKQELSQLGPSARDMGLSPEEIAADERLQTQELQRATLAKQVGHTTAVRSQLVNIMARITGVEVKESALDFEPEPERPVITEETSTGDALDAAAAVLKRMKKPS